MAPDPDPLARFVARVRRVGVEPNARELAEALWLARHIGPASLTAPAAPERRADATPPEPPATLPPAPARDATRARRTGDDAAVRLYPEQPSEAVSGPGTAFAQVRVGQATALPHALQLQRALRPLQRHRPPGRTPARVLDEQATAERAAETGLLLPVMLATGRRQARLQLLMDASTSTVVWDRTLAELRQICAGTGAFREVSVHYVHQGPDGRPLIGRTRDENRPLRAAEQLRDPTGRQLTLLLSDCAGPLWRSGRMHRLLHHWALAGPVALVQPLPQRMWSRTHLPALPGTLRRHEGLGARLEFTPRQGAAPAPALAVPVLGLTGTAFGVWARLLAGETGLSLPAAAGWVRPGHPPAAGFRPGVLTPPPSADALVRAFRRSTSTPAVQLAVSLSAVPLTLPVMQLVQRALHPATGPPELAEVLLSGLLRRGAEDGWYEFPPGVQELLLAMLPKGDAMLVLQLCGAYVERHFGRRADNFPALAAARLAGMEVHRGPGDGTKVPDAFAEVSSRILRRYAAKGPGSGDGWVDVPVRERITLLHAGCDRSWAAWMRRVLVAHGHEVVLRRWNIAPDEALEGALMESLEAGPGRVVLLLSNAFFHISLDQHLDWDAALGRLTPDRTQRLAAVLFGELQLSVPHALTSLLDPPDLTEVTESRAEEQLLARLGLDHRVRRTPLRGPGTRFPNTPPQVWEGVPERNIAFTGREELLDEVRGRFGGRSPVAQCVLTGPAGIGKTQLAVEYAHRFSAEYDAVWWLTGTDKEALRRQFNRLMDAAVAEVVNAASGGGRTVRASAGPRKERRLVVVDDFAPSEVIERSTYGEAHLLVTTRDGHEARIDELLPVGPFERRESVAYLRRHVAHLASAKAAEFAEVVGDMPLMLAHIAVLLDSPQKSVPELLELREWVERAALPLSFGSRQEVADIIGRASEPLVAPVDIAVEIIPRDWGRTFVWKIWMLSDGATRRLEVYTHDDRGVPFAELRASLVWNIDEALRRVETPDTVPTVQLSLVRELFDEPVERWRVPGPGSSPLAERCHVVLRDAAALHSDPEVRSARWAAFLRGPLLMAPLRLPQGASWRRSRQSDSTTPLNAVPVACTAGAALDDVLRAGFPLALWRRGRRHDDCAAFFDRVGEALDGAADIPELLTRIRALRTEEVEWARDLAVLYDPPGTGLPGSEGPQGDAS
ncbi:SAV_2336 N-terminal domain-related protein [Streptomyces sp. 21So2-11]|uniref:SAV_2336 N-terminal domain-related protein n=1 Tax=Streptomyces sp. 21So2-11 TaxID=3144408 RepID=UPI00321BE26C